MITPELVRDVAYFNPRWRPADIEQRARLLREARRLPHAGRGRSALPLSAEHIAAFLIGLAAAERATDVVGAVEVYAALGPESRTPGFAGRGTLGGAVAAMLEHPELLESVDSIAVCRSWPEAVIGERRQRKKKGHRIERHVYGLGDGAGGRRDRIKIEASIDPAMLRELAGR